MNTPVVDRPRLQDLALGVTVAQVSATNDPKGMGRIRVRFVVSGQTIESDWLQIMSFCAGPDYGAFFLPQNGDSALVAFGDGNPDQPYVLGFLWNGVLKPPVPDKQQQDVREIKTKKGKLLLFDDSSSGQLTLIDEKQNKVQIDTANNAITVDSQGAVTIKAKGKVTITGESVSIATTSGSVKLDMNSATMKLTGGQSLKLSATMIDLN